MRLRRRRILWRAVVGATVAGAIAGVGAMSASAIPTDPGDPGTCLSNTHGSLSLTDHAVMSGQSTQLTRSVRPGASCTGAMTQYVSFVDPVTGRKFVEPAGLTSVMPPAAGTYVLSVFYNGAFQDLASDSVAVSLPVVSGHPMASITGGGDQAALLRLGVSTPNAVVSVRSDVNLDLSGEQTMLVAPGVELFGQRDAAHPSGPRLFTTTFQKVMLGVGSDDSDLQSDNVRITGIRFDGGESSDPCDSAGPKKPDSDAVDVFSSQNVEVDHNEFYHWTGTAVQVRDARNHINRDNSDTVSIHDNWMHDNQHPTTCDLTDFSGHGGGYGVSVNDSGYAKIEHNVFDSNRHAVAANGHAGDGYNLVGNLFLRPGVDSRHGPVTGYNHQIDVHGLDTCGSGEHYNCGDAGEFFFVGYNTVANTFVSQAGDAIQLRGTPTSYAPPSTGGMQVVGNVFSNAKGGALTQTTDHGLVDGGGNRFSASGALGWAGSASAPCDFDGDGAKDQFRASGAGWWYLSSRMNHWVALATSTSTSVAFSDVNGDGLCDATSGGVTQLTMTLLAATAPYVHSDTPFGTGDWDGDGHADVIVRKDDTNQVWLYPGPGTRSSMTASPVVLGSGWYGLTPFGVADFNGDGHLDIIARQDFVGAGAAAGSLWLYPGNGARGPMNQNARTPILSGWNGFTPFGVADFNGDGHPDILVRQDYAGNGTTANGLWLYRGNGVTVGARTLVLDGWNGFTPFGVADFNKDGHPDVIARQDYIGNGDAVADNLYMYAGNGATVGARTGIGGGWNSFTPFGVGDWDGDGNQDVNGRQDFAWSGGGARGSLWNYPGTGPVLNQNARLQLAAGF
jgi:hypothetical protein